MTSEPRTPSTPQSLAQLRDSILEEHANPGAPEWCRVCQRKAPCPPVRLATALSVENVAAGLLAVAQDVTDAGYTTGKEDWSDAMAAALLGAIPVGGETKENT